MVFVADCGLKQWCEVATLGNEAVLGRTLYRNRRISGVIWQKVMLRSSSAGLQWLGIDGLTGKVVVDFCVGLDVGLHMRCWSEHDSERVADEEGLKKAGGLLARHFAAKTLNGILIDSSVTISTLFSVMLSFFKSFGMAKFIDSVRGVCRPSMPIYI